MMRSTWLLLVFTFIPWGRVPAEDVDFNRDVRPILSDKCYFCHGPDEENRVADLRLDVREAAIDLIESGDVADRILSDDEDIRMPPPESKLQLSEEEKNTLVQWIDQGAEYDRHWAFEPIPTRMDLPQPEEPAWCSESLDRFVLDRLEAEGLVPNPEAPPWRWLRRVTLDLTGLPPSSTEIKDFQNEFQVDPQAARENVVDRLLQSPSYGEHLSVSWLDAARYADSYGYQSDKLNTQWPYRDWVVRAINRNLPYDEFLTWQLAGDLLDNPTTDQKLATAFNRIHRLNNEGGAVFEEWRVENVADRVHTFGTAVLGLTMECCRCHDHKYDPISMRDYYSLAAFFNSIDESGVYDRTQKVPCPSLLLPTPEQSEAMQRANENLQSAEDAYHNALIENESRFLAWADDHSDNASIPDLKLALAFDQPFQDFLKETYHPSQSDRAWTSMPELVNVEDSAFPRIAPTLAAAPSVLTDLRSPDSKLKENEAKPSTRRAITLDGERGVTTKGVPALDRWTPFTIVVTLKDRQRSPHRSVIAHHTRGTDCGYNGWDLTIANGHLESRMARVWPGNAISVRTVEAIPKDQWCQIAASYDGSSRASGLKLYLNGRLLKTTTLRNELKKQANVVVDHGGELVIGQRFRDRGFDGGLIDDVRLYQRNLTLVELEHLSTGKPIAKTREYFSSAVDPSSRSAWNRLTEARKAVVMAEEAMDEIPIMKELDTPRAAHVLARGQYDAPRNASTLVRRDTFQQIGLPFPEDQPRDRLGLASWVTHPDNPLTARVAVNRFWSLLFTDPLVRTPENFGLQGELPTHPKLLDWLARDFVNHGWDVKRLCKQIVLSSTYRQDSFADEEKRKLDPDNRLLSRGPSHRLGAEQIRDLALAASGLMNPQRGGPPVSPYQPGKDLWRESNGMSPPYQQSVGTSLYRRSMYSVWKRTAPLPNMLALDATTREVCSVKRSRTNTPLQALVLLNDVQFVEACRVLAVSVLGEDVPANQIQEAFQRLTGRPADKQELEVLLRLWKVELEHYQQHPDLAEQLLSVGSKEVPADQNIEEIAAMTSICQSILNLDATVWKR